jgi:hypothetical protein
VLGFVAFFMPAGFGVRDLALQLLLAVELRARLGQSPAEADGVAALLAVWYRLLGTVAEMGMAAILYRFAPPAARAAIAEAVAEGPNE